jgi:uncharacterized protein with gpF-like domain
VILVCPLRQQRRLYLMSLVSKLLSALRRDEKPQAAGANQPTYTIPTVKFDASRVTEAVKEDLAKNIRRIRDFDASHFEHIYEAAFRSISRGRDLATLYNAIMELNLPTMTKKRAGEISRSLNNKATAIMTRDRQTSLGIQYATWVYSGAPCQMNVKKPSAKDIRQDATHRAADGKRYEVAKGMHLNGRWTNPGKDEGCKCISRPIIPGLDQ